MILTIQGRLCGLNDYTKACRSNKYVGAKMKADMEKIITAAIMEQIPNVHYEGSVRLDFRWFEKNTRRDLDNVCFAKKFILDALVSNKVIECDDWRGVIGFTDRFYLDKKNPRIEVEISGQEVIHKP